MVKSDLGSSNKNMPTFVFSLFPYSIPFLLASLSTLRPFPFFQVPFSKDCGPDNECVTDLVLQVNMDIRGSRLDGHVLGKPG